ncbi:DUF2829 domain-containing protein [Latilactobacillus sakei]
MPEKDKTQLTELFKSLFRGDKQDVKDQINLKVSKDEVIRNINLSKEQGLISGEHLFINDKTTFLDESVPTRALKREFINDFLDMKAKVNRMEKIHEPELAVFEARKAADMALSATRITNGTMNVVADKITIHNVVLNEMNFGQALEQIKSGKTVARKGWNGKGIYIGLIKPKDGDAMTHDFIHIDTTGLQTDNPDAPLSRVPWLASQTDMLAEDWQVINHV